MTTKYVKLNNRKRGFTSREGILTPGELNTIAVYMYATQHHQDTREDRLLNFPFRLSFVIMLVE